MAAQVCEGLEQADRALTLMHAQQRLGRSDTPLLPAASLAEAALQACTLENLFQRSPALSGGQVACIPLMAHQRLCSCTLAWAAQHACALSWSRPCQRHNEQARKPCTKLHCL